LQKSIKINPDFADAHYQLAVLLMNQKALKEIMKAKKAIHLGKTKSNKAKN